MSNLREIKQIVSELGPLVAVNVIICCDEGSPQNGTPPDKEPPNKNLATGIRFTIKILMENLDTNTWLEGKVRAGVAEVASSRLMRGEKPEFYSDTVRMNFDSDVNILDEDLILELIHPGISNNNEPHVRLLQIDDVVVLLKDGSSLLASVNMEEAQNFTDKHYEDYPPGHLNFVDGKRTSGQMNITLK